MLRTELPPSPTTRLCMKQKSPPLTEPKNLSPLNVSRSVPRSPPPAISVQKFQVRHCRGPFYFNPRFLFSFVFCPQNSSLPFPSVELEPKRAVWFNSRCVRVCVCVYSRDLSSHPFLPKGGLVQYSISKLLWGGGGGEGGFTDCFAETRALVGKSAYVPRL